MPLHDAVRSGRRDLVRWWLELHPAMVDTASRWSVTQCRNVARGITQRVCRDGRTALHVAAASRNVEMVAILVEHEADINKVAVASSGKLSTPLDVAVTRGHRWGTQGHLRSTLGST